MFVNCKDSVKCTFPDLERGQVGQKIIPNQETQQHEIIYNSFKVVGKGQLSVFHFKRQVLSDDCDFYELKFDRSG